MGRQSREIMARPRLTGKIFARPNTRMLWCWYYGPSGERVFESTGKVDKRAAQSYLADRRASVADGTWTPLPGKGAARTFADDWAAWLDGRDDVKTRLKDIAAGDNHILPVFGSKATA